MTVGDQAFRVWLSIGIAMLLVGSFFSIRTVSFLHTATHTEGTIISRNPNLGIVPLLDHRRIQ